MGKKPPAPAPAEAPRLNNPFAKLAERAAELPRGPETPVAPAARSAGASSAPAGPARAVVRYERKGHGGKEMTRVEQLELPASQLEKWLKELKQALGCGGVVDGTSLLVQGDQRERVRVWLEKRGVRRITVS